MELALRLLHSLRKATKVLHQMAGVLRRVSSQANLVDRAVVNADLVRMVVRWETRLLLRSTRTRMENCRQKRFRPRPLAC